MNSILFYIFAFILSIIVIYGWYAIYYAYFKTKDERQKYIVLRSTAQAFTIVLIYYLLDMIISVADIEQINTILNEIHSHLDVAPVAGMTIVLGVCMFVNKMKAGGH